MKVVIFEDSKWKNFLPLVWLRGVFDLKVGIFTIKEKFIKYLDLKENEIYLLFPPEREFIEKYYKDNGFKIFNPEKFSSDEVILFLSSRWLVEKEKMENFDGKEKVYFDENGSLIFAYLKPHNAFYVFEDFEKLKGKISVERKKFKVVNYLWDLIYFNEREIERDANFLNYNIHPDVRFLGKVGENIVLIEEKGRVYIDKGAVIYPFVYLEGPLYIGKNCVIKPFSFIGSSTIGEVCKICGEIHNTIFYGYSNKQHYGFLGHSYVGEWVNLGAGTTNSNLKNTYGNVKFYSLNYKGMVDTKKMFLGSFIGDHVKTSIGTLINTGSYIGIFSNVFGYLITPKFIPSFSWGKDKRCDLKKLFEVAERVMKRRNVRMNLSYRELISKVYNISQNIEFFGNSGY